MRRYGGQPLRGRGYEISLSAHCRGRPPCLPVFRWLVCGLGMVGRHGSLPLHVAVVVSGWCSGLVLLLLRKEYSRTTVPPYPRILTTAPPYPRTPEKCYSKHPPFLLLFATQELSIINCQLSIIDSQFSFPKITFTNAVTSAIVMVPSPFTSAASWSYTYGA